MRLNGCLFLLLILDFSKSKVNGQGLIREPRSFSKNSSSNNELQNGTETTSAPVTVTTPIGSKSTDKERKSVRSRLPRPSWPLESLPKLLRISIIKQLKIAEERKARGLDMPPRYKLMEKKRLERKKKKLQEQGPVQILSPAKLPQDPQQL